MFLTFINSFWKAVPETSSISHCKLLSKLSWLTVSLYLLETLFAGHVFCLLQPQSLMDPNPLCVPWCIWRQYPNPSVFNASPFVLLSFLRKPFFCSFQPMVPMIQNTATSDLMFFWHDAACSASWAVDFSKRTENSSTNLPHVSPSPQHL